MVIQMLYLCVLYIAAMRAFSVRKLLGEDHAEII